MAISRSNAHVEITSSASKFGTGIRDAKKKLGAFGSDVRNTFRSAGGAIARVGGGIAAGLGLAGGFGLSDVVGDVLGVEKALTRFQIAGERTPEQMDALRRSLSDVAKTSGIARGELIQGASAYVALTGDADGAANAMGLFAKVANATGASMEDISATAASMRDNLKIDPKDFEAAFSALHVQGKAGAVELRELAQVMAGVAPQFSKFAGGAGTAGLAELGATLQVLRKDFGTTAEAATGARALFGSLVRGSGKLKALGVEVFDVNGEKRNFTQIIDEILAKDISEPVLQKILGSDEALRSIGALRTHRALLTDITAASKDQTAIERDAATYRESAAGKLAITLETLKTKMADIFTPERVEKWANALSGAIGTAESMIDSLTKGAKWMGEGAARTVDALAGALGFHDGMNDDGTMTRAQAREYADYYGERGDREAVKLKAKTVEWQRQAGEMGIDTKKGGWQDELFKRLRELSNPKPVTVNSTLVVSGNEIASAVANAKDRRRTP